MKRSDIVIGTEYAVEVDRMRADTRAGNSNLRRATVRGFSTPKYRSDPVKVLVTLAEPYRSTWNSEYHPNNGKTEFAVATRNVVCTWTEHEPAAVARSAAEEQARVEREAADALLTANRAELRSLLPEHLLPTWLATEWGKGGYVTVGDLLAIVHAVKGTS